MPHRALSRVLAAVAALGAVILAPPALAQVTIRLAHTLPQADAHHQAAMRLAELVKDKTGGAVQITVFPGGSLGNDPAIVEGVKLGTIDMAVAGNPFFTSFAPRFNVLDLPFLFADAAHVDRVLDGDVGRELMKDLEAQGVKGIAFWEIGFRNLTNNVRPVQKPEDVKGLKIRTTPNPAHLKAFRLLDASPAPMPFPEVYLALQTRTVDGQENPVNLIYNSKFHEVQKHLSLTRHAYTASVMVMNLARFNALTPAQQKALIDAAQEAGAFQRKLQRGAEADSLAKMKSAGMQVVDEPARGAFETAVASPVRQDYTEKHGKALVDAIDRARKP